MKESATYLKEKLAECIDNQYQIKDMGAFLQILASLEQSCITKDDLAETRLGKAVNEVRRNSKDADICRRLRNLVKKWQKLVGSSSSSTLTTQRPDTPLSNGALVKNVRRAAADSSGPLLRIASEANIVSISALDSTIRPVRSYANLFNGETEITGRNTISAGSIISNNDNGISCSNLDSTATTPNLSFVEQDCALSASQPPSSLVDLKRRTSPSPPVTAALVNGDDASLRLSTNTGTSQSQANTPHSSHFEIKQNRCEDLSHSGDDSQHCLESSEAVILSRRRLLELGDDDSCHDVPESVIFSRNSAQPLGHYDSLVDASESVILCRNSPLPSGNDDSRFDASDSVILSRKRRLPQSADENAADIGATPIDEIDAVETEAKRPRVESAQSSAAVILPSVQSLSETTEQKPSLKFTINLREISNSASCSSKSKKRKKKKRSKKLFPSESCIDLPLTAATDNVDRNSPSTDVAQSSGVTMHITGAGQEPRDSPVSSGQYVHSSSARNSSSSQLSASSITRTDDNASSLDSSLVTSSTTVLDSSKAFTSEAKPLTSSSISFSSSSTAVTSQLSGISSLSSLVVNSANDNSTITNSQDSGINSILSITTNTTKKCISGSTSLSTNCDDTSSRAALKPVTGASASKSGVSLTPSSTLSSASSVKPSPSVPLISLPGPVKSTAQLLADLQARSGDAALCQGASEQIVTMSLFNELQRDRREDTSTPSVGGGVAGASGKSRRSRDGGGGAGSVASSTGTGTPSLGGRTSSSGQRRRRKDGRGGSVTGYPGASSHGCRHSPASSDTAARELRRSPSKQTTSYGPVIENEAHEVASLLSTPAAAAHTVGVSSPLAAAASRHDKSPLNQQAAHRSAVAGGEQLQSSPGACSDFTSHSRSPALADQPRCFDGAEVLEQEHQQQPQEQQSEKQQRDITATRRRDTPLLVASSPAAPSQLVSVTPPPPPGFPSNAHPAPSVTIPPTADANKMSLAEILAYLPPLQPQLIRWSPEHPEQSDEEEDKEEDEWLELPAGDSPSAEQQRLQQTDSISELAPVGIGSTKSPSPVFFSLSPDHQNIPVDVLDSPTITRTPLSTAIKFDQPSHDTSAVGSSESAVSQAQSSSLSSSASSSPLSASNPALSDNLQSELRECDSFSRNLDLHRRFVRCLSRGRSDLLAKLDTDNLDGLNGCSDIESGFQPWDSCISSATHGDTTLHCLPYVIIDDV